MPYHWTEPTPFSGDPFADWYTTLEDGKTGPSGVVWLPFAIFFPPVGELKLADRVDGILSQLKDLDDSSAIAINTHDVFHWLHAAFSYRNQISELIVFLRSDESESPEVDPADIVAALSKAMFDDDKSRERVRVSAAGIALQSPGRTGNKFRERFIKGFAEELAQAIERTSTGAKVSESACKPMVISAVIDHGIPNLNTRFTKGFASTRILGHWDQGEGTGDDTVIGYEINQTAINDEIENVEKLPGASSARGRPSLPRTRSNLPHISGDTPLALSSTHGGMVLDLAAGQDPKPEGGTAWNILAVDLPPQIVRQTNGTHLDPYVKSAMNWIFWRVERLKSSGHRVSVVVTYAFGGYSGRRDGHGGLDRDFQLRLERGEITTICVAAGNGYLEDIYADLAHRDITEPDPLELVIPPDNAAPTFLQLWLEDAPPQMPFGLECSPPGTLCRFGPLQAGQSVDLVPAGDGAAIARACFLQDAPQGAAPDTAKRATTRGRLVIAVAPTAADGATAPVGRWHLRALSQTLPIWIERGDSVTGFKRDRRQARFDHTVHRRRLENGRPDEGLAPDKVIRRAGTLSDTANAEAVIVVGACRGVGGEPRIAPYSAAGGGAVPRHPDLCALAEFSAARPDRLAAGTGSSATRALNGTSAAAAIAGRIAAEFLLQPANTDLVGQRAASGAVRSHLTESTQRSSGSATRPDAAPPERLGAGIATENIPRRTARRRHKQNET